MNCPRSMGSSAERQDAELDLDDNSSDSSIDLVELAERLDHIAPTVARLRGDRVIKVHSADDIAVSKTRAAITDRYEAHEERRAGPPRMSRIARLRIPELERYLRYRYGRVVPDDDAGRADLMILANHIAQNPNDPYNKIHCAIRYWAAPWMSPDEVRAIADKVLAKPRRYRASTLGKLLRLTEEERTLLGITTIRAFTTTDAEVKEKELSRRRDAATTKRRSEGVVAREDWLAASLSRTKPWEAEGISRSTWERRRKASAKADASPSPQLEGSSYGGHTPASRPPPMIPADAIELPVIDYAAFGIIAVVVMRGHDVVSTWRRGT
jgi:hypothetical protein